MNRLKFINLSFVLLLLFSGAIGVRTQSETVPDIRGRITKLNRSDAGAQTNNLLGSILVEREAGTGGEYDKADVIITNETRIYAQADEDKRTPLKIDALKLDQRVAVRFAPGLALLSYPIQVGATKIVILSDSPPNDGNSLVSKQTTPNLNPEMKKLRRAIDAGNAVWVNAWEAGDAVMILATFTPDGKELASGGKVYKGRKRILVLMRDLMKKRGGRAKLTVTTTDFWLDGDTAYETGIARYEFTAGGQPQTLERRYFTIWKRNSKRGAWKIHSNTGIAKE